MPRKGQKMSAAQRAAIGRAVRERNAAAHRGAVTDPASIPPAPGDSAPAMRLTTEQVGGLEVEISGPPPPDRPLTLTDRLKRLVQTKDPAQVAAAAKKATKASDNFIVGLTVPVSGVLAASLTALWSEEYRACAPSKAELEAFIGPLFRIFARRVEISTQMGPDGEDIAAMISVCLVFSFRSITTYMERADELEKANAVEEAEQLVRRPVSPRRTPPANSGGNNQVSPSGASRTSGRIDPGQGGNDAIGQPGAGQDPTETDAQFARRVISEAFSQDREYRFRNGLL